MIINLLQRYQIWLFILLSVLCGLAAAQLVATGVGIWATPAEVKPLRQAAGATSAQRRQTLNNYLPILQRDIFNKNGGNLVFEQHRTSSAKTAKATKAPSKWTLLGTISGGATPLATLHADGQSETYRLNEKLPDGAVLVLVDRNQVELLYPNGERVQLEIEQKSLTGLVEQAAVQRPNTSNTNPSVESAGPNRWRIPAQVAKDARSNIGSLMRQAQAIPYLENGKTTGFQIKMIQPGSMIAQLGLQQGDVLREINGLPLNSPEKALQIFGQLRQARQVSIGLERRGQAMSFTYEIR